LSREVGVWLPLNFVDEFPQTPSTGTSARNIASILQVVSDSMRIARNEPDGGKQKALARLWVRLEDLHDRIFSDESKTVLRYLAIRASIAGFAIHLALIFLARSLAHPHALIAEAGQNYLAAISTPFNFILFYEVLTLIAALPAATTRSIANQYEIVSLIFIREVFKDIASASALFREHQLTPEALPILVHMGTGFAMFLLVAVFQHVTLGRTRPTGSTIPSRGLTQFISQKKLIAIGLAALLMGMAAYNLGILLIAVFQMLQTGHATPPSTTTFYNDLFTVMIFTDVLILILSLEVSGRYEMVFRNAAFVVSIILIRFSLTEAYPYGAPIALLAMVFGILTLAVFNYHARINEMAGRELRS